jgi:fatty acyl-CoA reductase
MPCVIVRPSIIGASWQEPFPGWVDGFNGLHALFPACGTGVLKTMLAKHDAIADIVPVDLVVNLTLTAGWFIGSIEQHKAVNRVPPVFNCTSGQLNKFTWGMLEKYGRVALYKNPFDNIVIYPNPYFTSSK